MPIDRVTEPVAYDEHASRATTKWLNTKQAAKYLGLSKSTLAKNRVYGGGPEYAEFGHAIRNEIDALDRWAKPRLRRSTSDLL